MWTKTMLRNVLTAFVFISMTAVYAQQQGGTSMNLLGISVSGNESASTSVIRLSSGLNEGDKLTLDDIQDAIRHIWALNIFSDVSIILDRQVGSGVYLTIQVKEYPKLQNLVIEGNKKLKTLDLEREIGMFRGQVINPNDISLARKRILKKYQEKGYTLAKVETRTEDVEESNRKTLFFTIDEGKRVQVEQIRFFGNQHFDDHRLQKQMDETKENRWWRNGDFDPEKYEEDKKLVAEFYHNEGYKDARVVRDSIYYDDTQAKMFLDIWVEEGPCYYFGDITWEGNVIFDEDELNSLLTFKPGDRYNAEEFTKSTNEEVGGAYYNKGYIYAQINPVEKISGDTLNYHFVIVENSPVTIGRIVVKGNTTTKERVIRRQLRIRPGDIFSKELLVRSGRDLMMLNYFANVNPVPMPADDQDKLDLIFEVEEKSTQTANLSIGWSELDKLIGSVGLGMNNLFGNGQQLSLNWNFGRFYRSFSLGFSEPWFLNTPTLIGFNVHDTQRDAYYIGYSQKSRGFSLQTGRRFSWPDNYFRGDWIYRYDETTLGDFSDYMKEYNPNNIVNQDWPLNTSSITQVFSRNSLDNPEFPTEGSIVSFSTTFAGGPLGGNVGYHKHQLSAEFFFPAVSPRVVFMARAMAGYMQELNSSSRIQYTDYFFMGGSGMSRSIPLRGYDDPLAGGQYRYEGGRTMLKTTVELRFPVISNPTAFGIIFAEAGNTWLTLDVTDPFDLKKSVGIGARIYMPMVGMLGFDYAYGFDNLDANGNVKGQWKPHFVFGKSF
ncbi:outer membrane protein assembly factor BamA [bacterium]|nr:outer membrane protein assembly factor BamA [bacterium]